MTSVTEGVPVGDLAVARAWYDKMFEEPSDLEPVPGVVEYEIGGVWVQLMGGGTAAPGWVHTLQWTHQVWRGRVTIVGQHAKNARPAAGTGRSSSDGRPDPFR